jgi:pimeloyl-ACP methyl ester carboxylesterase
MNMDAFDLNRADRRPTVVLLHSSASSSRQWTALAGLLQPHFEVRALDLHGHGTRPAWSERRPVTLADEAALVEPILREAGRVHLVGHSYGGAVALKVAELHPGAVASLIAYEPVLFGWLFDDDRSSAAALEVIGVADTLRSALHARNFSAAARAFIDYWTGAGSWDSMRPERQQGVAPRMPAVLAQFTALAESVPSAARLRGPQSMTFLGGSRTVTSTRRIGELLRARLPHATHETLPGLGHMGPITHADMVNRRVVDILQRDAARDRQLAERAA